AEFLYPLKHGKISIKAIPALETEPALTWLD
ncbi:MAG: hypothetical protein ACI84K_000390, partial [Pseudohongiellaceae bacterium]